MIRAVPLILVVAVGQLCTTVVAAQAPDRLPVIGFLAVTVSPSDPVARAFRDGLAQFGYVDGRNITIEHRNADGRVDQLPRLAEELVRMPVDIIAVGSEPALGVATKATTTIPVVFVGYDRDPVAAGLVNSLSRPGGNITGIFTLQPDLWLKRLELLRDAIPGISRVAVLWDPINRKGVSDIEAGGRSLGVAIQPIELSTPYEFDAAFRLAKKGKAGAVMVVFSPGFYIHRARLARAALDARVPTMFGDQNHVEAGGLISYGPPMTDTWGRAAYYVDRILKGAKPGELPVEMVSRFRLVINLKTAKALGIKIPESIMLRADEVIK